MGKYDLHTFNKSLSFSNVFQCKPEEENPYEISSLEILIPTKPSKISFHLLFSHHNTTINVDCFTLTHVPLYYYILAQKQEYYTA